MRHQRAAAFMRAGAGPTPLRFLLAQCTSHNGFVRSSVIPEVYPRNRRFIVFNQVAGDAGASVSLV